MTEWQKYGKTEIRKDRITELQKDRQGKSSIAPTFSKRGYNEHAILLQERDGGKSSSLQDIVDRHEC